MNYAHQKLDSWTSISSYAISGRQLDQRGGLERQGASLTQDRHQQQQDELDSGSRRRPGADRCRSAASIDGNGRWYVACAPCSGISITDCCTLVTGDSTQLSSPEESRSPSPYRLTLDPCPVRLLPLVPAPNYGTVAQHHIYRSAFPQAHNIEFISELGVKSIL